MWMTDYIKEIKRQLVKVYKFKPLKGSTKEEYLVEVPDGEYPMTIQGKVDHVRIKDGKIHCCNFKKRKKSPPKIKASAGKRKLARR
jgi:hypothetical protein